MLVSTICMRPMGSQPSVRSTSGVSVEYGRLVGSRQGKKGNFKTLVDKLERNKLSKKTTSYKRQHVLKFLLKRKNPNSAIACSTTSRRPLINQPSSKSFSLSC